MSKNALYSVPDCHDGEAQEKPKSAPKLGQQGREGVEEDLLLHLGELGHRPEAVLDLTVNGPGLVRFEVNVEELVLVVVMPVLPTTLANSIRAKPWYSSSNILKSCFPFFSWEKLKN